jgi:hypothetical protein
VLEVVSIGIVGDCDEDDVPDIAVGYCASDGAGALTLFRGLDGVSIGNIAGEEGECLGSSVAPWIDHDGDGVQDILVGAKEWTYGGGRVAVISGATRAVLSRIVGESQDQGFGSVVAACSIGVPTLCISIRPWGKFDAGAVSVFAGRDFEPVGRITLEGLHPSGTDE